MKTKLTLALIFCTLNAYAQTNNVLPLYNTATCPPDNYSGMARLTILNQNAPPTFEYALQLGTSFMDLGYTGHSFRGYQEFDLSGIPKDANIYEADLIGKFSGVSNVNVFRQIGNPFPCSNINETGWNYLAGGNQIGIFNFNSNANPPRITIGLDVRDSVRKDHAAGKKTIFIYRHANEDTHHALVEVFLEVKYQIPPTPYEPRFPVISNLTQNSVQLSWTAPIGPISQLGNMVPILEYRVYSGNNLIKTIPATAGSTPLAPPTSTTITGLNPNTQYTFTVRAYNTGGESPNSTSVTIPATILGDDEVCFNGSVFTFAYPPAGAITWSLPSGGVFSFSSDPASPEYTKTIPSSNQITVYRIGLAAGNGALTASVNGTSASKTITPCIPEIVGSDTVCYPGSFFTLSGKYPPNTTITWEINSPFSLSSAVGNGVTVTKTYPSGAGATLTAKANGTTMAAKYINPCMTPNIIVGPDEPVCFTESVFYLDNPSPGTITWMVSTPFVIKSSSGSQVTIAKSGTNGNPNGSLFAYVNGSIVADRTIKATPTPVINGYGVVCYEGSPFSAINHPPNYAWTLTGPFSFSLTSNVTSTTASSPTVYRTAAGGNTGTLSLRSGGAGGPVAVDITLTPCAAPVINGPGTVCFTVSTFTMSNPISNFTWTLTGPFSFSSAGTLTSTTLASAPVFATTGSGASGELLLRFGDANGTIVARKPITACLTEMIGPGTVCYSPGSTFTLLNPKGTVYWTVSNSNFTLSSTVGNSITVTRQGVAFGNATLSARSGSVSGPVVAEKIISPCIPQIDGDSYLSCGSGAAYYIQYIPGATYSWRSDVLSVSYAYLDYASFYAPYYEGSGIVACTITIGGVSSVYTKHVYVDCYSPSFIFYPNPASGMVNIEMDTERYENASNARGVKIEPTYDIRLYDGMGNLVRNTTTKSDKMQLNVSGLPNGTYYLHVYDGISGKPEIKQIIVQH